MPGTADRDVLRVGGFELDLRARELRQAGRTIRLQEQPFEILHLLLERRGRVVTRDELRERLWPQGTFVDFEHSLNAAVKRLRAALGDDADNPAFVETLPRRGYRFIGAVDAPDEPLDTPATPAVRLAVLPFTELGHSGETDHFGEGLTDEMISQLGRLCRGCVGVVSGHSSMAFRRATASAREIGQALRADLLLEGTVRREGDRVRISARLISSATDTQLWVRSYDRQVADCLTVQADVAARIAQSLALELAPQQGMADGAARNPAAWNAYLKGRYHWQRTADTGAAQARAFLEEAVGLDPAFGAAWAVLSTVHVLRADHHHEVPRLALDRAADAARRALTLEPDLAAAHYATAEVARLRDWDWTGAREAYRQAIALNPCHEGARGGYAKFLAAQGLFAQAIREADVARELDPRCLTMNTIAAWVRYLAGDLETAIDLCRHNLEMDEHYAGARRLLGAVLLAAGQRREALRVLEAAAGEHGDPISIAWFAHALAVTGQRAAAVGCIDQVGPASGARPLPHVHLAIAWTGLGDLDAAFRAVETACDARETWVANVAVDPRLAPLRADARYPQVVRRLGLRG
ncbi:MAG: winged helix-turn-helix domain-containing tetratricopeptide repeat protein [Vicinamibacterales bacterium]